LHPVCVDGVDVIVIVCGVSSIAGSVNAHSPSYQLDRTSLVLLTTCLSALESAKRSAQEQQARWVVEEVGLAVFKALPHTRLVVQSVLR
jgi:hypothetical protein